MSQDWTNEFKLEKVEHKIGDHVIVELRGSLKESPSMYCPLTDFTDMERYFCWSLEEAIVKRLWYLKHYSVEPNLMLSGILDELGCRTPNPTDDLPQRPLAYKLVPVLKEG